MMNALIRDSLVYDEWLSTILGETSYALQYSIVFLEQFAAAGSPEQRAFSDFLRKPVFIYAKLPAAEIAHSAVLQSYGFAVIETSLVLQKPLQADQRVVCDAHIRPAGPEDQIAVYELAARSFSFSRFHLDPAIPDSCADTLKAEWTRSFFLGRRGTEMLVAEHRGGIAGFILLADGADDTVVIDLMAVDPAHRLKNIASALIAAAENLNPHNGAIVVGTQAANSASLRLYEKNGFRLSQSRYVLHFHGPKPHRQ